MNNTQDAGLEVLDFVYRSMKIDECWSIREPRSFTWWGHRLAQRVSVEPVRRSHGFEVARLSAETDLLRNVQSTQKTADRLAGFNQHASLSAFVWYPDEGRIRLRCSAGVHAETIETLKPLFSAAVSIQVADAHVKVDALATLLGGEPDTSGHPTGGQRQDIDDMLNVIEQLFAREGRKAKPFTEADFARAAAVNPPLWLEAETSGTSLKALLGTEKYPSAIAVLYVEGSEFHPQLGFGLLMQLNLPITASADQTLVLSHKLNLAEAHAWETPYFFGAWCPGGNKLSGLVFTAFIPAAVCRTNLIEAMSLQMVARVQWACEQIDGGTQGAMLRSDESSRGVLRSRRVGLTSWPRLLWRWLKA